jgi:hypothetical protein
MTDDHDLPMEEYRRAGLEVTRGNPGVYKSLWSRRADVTLANPFGPPVLGWEEVSARLDLAASNYRDGRDYEFENVSTVITAELAYTVEIERIRTRVRGSDELAPIAIRATTVFSPRGRRVESDAPPRRRNHLDAPGGIGAPELESRRKGPRGRQSVFDRFRYGRLRAAAPSGLSTREPLLTFLP